MKYFHTTIIMLMLAATGMMLPAQSYAYVRGADPNCDDWLDQINWDHDSLELLNTSINNLPGTIQKETVDVANAQLALNAANANLQAVIAAAKAASKKEMSSTNSSTYAAVMRAQQAVSDAQDNLNFRQYLLSSSQESLARSKAEVIRLQDEITELSQWAKAGHCYDNLV